MNTEIYGMNMIGPDTLAKHVLADAGNTGDRYALVSLTLPPYHPGLPLHTHPENAEGCYVVAGTLAVTQGDATVTLTPGAAAHIPAGVVHSLWNPTAAPTIVLLIYTPGVAAAAAAAFATAPEDMPPYHDTS
jgi:quercetin dioxygenase-like cupin family protein